MEKNANKMHLPTIDDLFTTQEERDDEKLEKVIDIDINSIDSFPDHPFKVVENEELKQMKESISEKGVLSPVLVRKKQDGRYEMISGHRRMFASKLAGKETIPSIVRDLSDDEATIIMVDSNLQREKILPSERAFAYKMKLDAMNRQGKRTDLTSSQVGKKLNAYEELAEEVGESKSNVHRFIRLTELIKPILDMVDNEDIAFSPAVEISYLTKEEQKWLLNSIECNIATPSLSQAQEMKRLSQSGKLDEDKIEEIISTEKPNQVEKIKLDLKTVRSKIPRGISSDNYVEYIYKALDFYNRHIEKQKSHEVR